MWLNIKTKGFITLLYVSIHLFLQKRWFFPPAPVSLWTSLPLAAHLHLHFKEKLQHYIKTSRPGLTTEPPFQYYCALVILSASSIRGWYCQDSVPKLSQRKSFEYCYDICVVNLQENRTGRIRVMTAGCHFISQVFEWGDKCIMYNV